MEKGEPLKMSTVVFLFYCVCVTSSTLVIRSWEKIAQWFIVLFYSVLIQSSFLFLDILVHRE